MDMNKDKIGLLKYISMFMLETLIIVLWFYISSLMSICEEKDAIIFKCLAIFLTVIFFLLSYIYLLLPIVSAIIAIKQHWSRYLDGFFNQLKLPTIVFILDIAILFIFIKFTFVIGNEVNILWYLFFSGVFIPYCLIYPVILVHNLLRILKK